jgi:hypothetical protein
VAAWAASTGVPAEKVAEAVRSLDPALIRKTRAGTVMLSAGAAMALFAHFRLSEGEDGGIAENPPKTGPWEPETITVLSLPPNTRILLGSTEDGRRVRVRVRDNRLFIVRTRIEARRTEPAQPDIYELTSRHPRRRGDRP